MKWHDARVEPPQDGTYYIVQKLISYGNVQYAYSVQGFYDEAYWEAEEYGHIGNVSGYPFYATVEEIEEELSDD